jgi:uncharacterized protein (TIGR00266 family)
VQEEIIFSPEYSVARVTMRAGETIIAEPGAMVAMTPNIEVKAQLAQGGILGSLKRGLLGGESFFTTTFTAEGDAELLLGRGQPGDILCLELNNESVLVQSGGFIACTEGIKVDTTWGGVRSFFGQMGLFLLKISGTGKLFVGAFGAFHSVDLDNGQDLIVDNGHVVCFSDNTSFTIDKTGGFKTFLTSGEMLVCRFRGPGRVWLQTRNPGAFSNWVDRFRPVQHTENND